MKRMADSEIVAKSNGSDYRYRSEGTLRFQGRLAFLDGRNVMSREWNRRATRLAALKPERAHG